MIVQILTENSIGKYKDCGSIKTSLYTIKLNSIISLSVMVPFSKASE
jgi:hypothetical protein